MKAYGLNVAQVLESKSRYGDNHLTEHETESFWDKFRGNLGDPMIIVVRLRGNKKVQNLSSMWYKELAKRLATQGDFGREPSYYTLLPTAIPDTGTCF